MKRFLALFLLAAGIASAQVVIPWTDVDKTGSSLADLANHDFSLLANKPTSAAGYGITNGAKLDSLGALTWAANTAPYYTGSGTAGTYSLSSFARGVLGSADATTWRSNTGSFPATGGDITGTAGAGYLGFVPQSVKPSTPASGFRLYADSGGKLSWIGTNGFVRTFDGTANTADRTYTLPDASGSVVIDSATQTLTNKAIVATSISTPGAGSNSELFGAGAAASAPSSVALGKGANAIGDSTHSSNSVVVGYNAAAGTTSTDEYGEVVLGSGASANKAGAVVIGYSAAQTGSNQYAIAIGRSAGTTGGIRIGAFGTAAGSSIAIGYSVTSTAGQVLLCPGNTDTEFFPNAAIGAATGYYTRLNGVQPGGAGATGGTLYLAGGKAGDATGTGGVVKIQTAASGSGTTLQDVATFAADRSTTLAGNATVSGGTITIGSDAPLYRAFTKGLRADVTDFGVQQAAGTAAGWTWYRGINARWYLAENSATESGGNVGSDLVLQSYNDTGSLIGTVLTFSRATGAITTGTGATLAIAGTSAIKGVRTATATLDFPSIAANGGTQDLTVTVSGAVAGDAVNVVETGGAFINAGVILRGTVTSANTVTVRATNCTTGAIDPASATYRVTVESF